MRIPTIVYSTHVITTLIPILAHILLHDFTDSVSRGPRTREERLTLAGIYAPYLLVPVLLLLTMLFNPVYCKGTTKAKRN